MSKSALWAGIAVVPLLVLLPAPIAAADAGSGCVMLCDSPARPPADECVMSCEPAPEADMQICIRCGLPIPFLGKPKEEGKW
ncbi:hypothetical protein GV794_21160 [Nocardia cyriacigeorgica]|uniref:Uncharacterized protein n=1 Tax=Nocardia cyriacigeorgica TaxID=135487 RepID=A0ABX0CWI2_9NOCA|nr:hypothetical protein [Nocardia cyriacigeorgica]NEW58142.1 hypothetical protein [Nocardia cyriacigeorgica]